MKPFYYCHAIAEPLREASDMKPLLFRMVTRMRVYQDTEVCWGEFGVEDRGRTGDLWNHNPAL